MIDQNNTLFVIRFTLTIFILTLITTGFSVVINIIFCVLFYLFLRLTQKSQIFIYFKKIDILINAYLSRIILKILWIIIYLLSIPLLKIWSNSRKKNQEQQLVLSHFDFKSEYSCIVQP